MDNAKALDPLVDDIDKLDASGQTALIRFASMSGQKGEDGLKKCILAHADLNIQDKDGNTALMRAAYNGHDGCVKTLVDAGADMNIQNKDGNTALGNTALMRVARNGCVKILVDAGADMTIQNNDGDTVLMTAAYNGHDGCMKILVDAGADFNIQNKDGNTALMRAVADPKMDHCVKMLVDAGADMNIQNNNGDTALMKAVAEPGRDGCMQILVDAGADMNISDKNGITALMRAARVYDNCVKMLVDAGADMNIQDKNGDTALMKAAASSDGNGCVKILIDAGADMNIQSNNGDTALMTAASKRDNSGVKILVDAGADFNIRSNDGNTALLYVVRWGMDDCVKFLVDAGADMNIPDRDGITALMQAVRGGRDGCVKILAEAGADLDFQMKYDKTTALMEASKKGATAVVKLLLDAQADTNLQDNKGRTALQLAATSKTSTAVQQLFEKHGTEQMVLLQDLPKRLAAATTGEQCIAELRKLPAVCYYTMKVEVKLPEAVETNVKAMIEQHLLSVVKSTRSPAWHQLDIPPVLEEAQAIYDVLRHFVDEPIEELRRIIPADQLATITTPQWLNATVVNGAYGAFEQVLNEEKESLQSSPRRIEAYKTQARVKLADDRVIYQSVFAKQLNQQRDVARKLKQSVVDAVSDVTARVGKPRPTQPGLSAKTTTPLDLKMQALQAVADLESFARELSNATSAEVQGLDKPLKKSPRLCEKLWLRNELVSVCDVARVLVVVKDLEHMLRVHEFLCRSKQIDIVDVKDRLSNPTSGAWVDVVYLFRSTTGSRQRHIFEAQLVLESMLTARSGLHAHKAYAEVRHLSEALAMVGVDVEVPPSDDRHDVAADEVPRDAKDATSVLEDLRSQIRQLQTALQRKDVEMQQKDVEMQQKDVEMQQKDVEMQQKDVEMQQKDVEMQQKDVEMQQRDVAFRAELQQRDVEMRRKDEKLRAALTEIVSLKKQAASSGDLAHPPSRSGSVKALAALFK